MDELLDISRTWVNDHYKQAKHLLRAEDWLRCIDPGASEAMLLAALTHDMERAFPGEDSPKQDVSRGPDDPVYNEAHSNRSARVVSEFLRDHRASEQLIAEVARLIRVHEFGGWPDADYVQAADSLSFLEVNVDFFLSRINAVNDDWTKDAVRAKFDWMYERIKIPQARSLAQPLHEAAIQKLNAIT